MEVVEGLDDLNRKPPRSVVSVGNFDGVHLGHQFLLSKVIERARAIKGTAVAVTFDPHPVRVLNPSGGPPLLTVKRRKQELIAAQGIDLLVFIRFTKQFAGLTAQEFFEKVLVRKFDLAEVVVGHDASFGRDRQGSPEFIQGLAHHFGFLVHALGPVEVAGWPVSSTRARELIQTGRVDEVIELLGRPYQISGRVVRGHDRGGRLLGFPTANLNLVNEVVPARGVYAVRVEFEDGRRLKGVTNVGLNPTFNNDELSVETFVLDFDQDLYNQFIRLDFMDRLRDETRFNTPAELTAQIKRDVARAREVLA